MSQCFMPKTDVRVVVNTAVLSAFDLVKSFDSFEVKCICIYLYFLFTVDYYYLFILYLFYFLLCNVFQFPRTV